MNKFTDAVNSRVSLKMAERLVGGLGVVAETRRVWDGGSFSLCGSLDFEQTLSGAKTVVEVSGEKLISESTKNRVLLSLGGLYRRGRFSIGGEVSAGGLGSDDREYSGRIKLGIHF